MVIFSQVMDPSSFVRSQDSCTRSPCSPWLLTVSSDSFEHTHRKSLSSEAVEQCFARATPPPHRLPTDRCTCLRRGWCFLLQLLRNFQDATIPVLLKGEKGQEHTSGHHAFLPGSPLCPGHLAGCCSSNRCSACGAPPPGSCEPPCPSCSQ